jgi:hypothetical protein
MAEPIVCEGDPRLLLKTPVCLSSVSKDASGSLPLRSSEKQECKKIECITLKTVHNLKLALKTHTCDSTPGKLFNGTFFVRELIHAYESGSGLRRGIHTGLFEWTSTSGTIIGALSGTTNAGLVRHPLPKPIEKCHSPGVMTGRLCGTIEKAKDDRLIGCEVLATYRFLFTADAKGGKGPVRGTIEGDIVCRC